MQNYHISVYLNKNHTIPGPTKGRGGWATGQTVEVSHTIKHVVAMGHNDFESNGFQNKRFAKQTLSKLTLDTLVELKFLYLSIWKAAQSLNTTVLKARALKLNKCDLKLDL